MVGDVGEDNVYHEFRIRGDLHQFLCKEFTADCIRDHHVEL